MKSVQYTFLLFALLFAYGCDETFQPKGPFKERMVVYGILSTQLDTQFVRVYSTYDPPGFDPLERSSDSPVNDAQVSITQGGTTVALRETTVTRSDTTRYKDKIQAFVGYPFVVSAGTGYTLNVTSPTHGTATASTVVPGKGFVTLRNAALLQNPSSYTTDQIPVDIVLSSAARGYLVRFFVEYEIQQGGGIIERVEVPQTGTEYPQLTRSGSILSTMQFAKAAYIATVSSVVNNSSYQIKFKRAYFFLIQVDLPLYNYYNVVRGFRDNFSIRTDQPDYTNIKGGVGIFGSFSADTLVYTYSSPDIGTTRLPD